MKTRRAVILGTVEDLVTRFVYYDRKESESLPMEALNEAIRSGEITKAEIVAEFARHLDAVSFE